MLPSSLQRNLPRILKHLNNKAVVPSVWGQLPSAATAIHNPIHHRALSTSCAAWKSKPDDDDEYTKIVRNTIEIGGFPRKSLYTRIQVKLKLFLLRSYFDQNFEESEFIAGAKQVTC